MRVLCAGKERNNCSDPYSKGRSFPRKRLTSVHVIISHEQVISLAAGLLSGIMKPLSIDKFMTAEKVGKRLSFRPWQWTKTYKVYCNHPLFNGFV